MEYRLIPPKPLADFANQSLIELTQSVFALAGGQGSPRELFTDLRWAAIIHLLLCETPDKAVAFLYIMYSQEIHDSSTFRAASRYVSAVESPMAETTCENVYNHYRKMLSRLYKQELKFTPTCDAVKQVAGYLDNLC